MKYPIKNFNASMRGAPTKNGTPGSFISIFCSDNIYSGIVYIFYNRITYINRRMKTNFIYNSHVLYYIIFR